MVSPLGYAAVGAAAEKRLSQFEEALRGRQWLVGETFRVADVMMSSVLKAARGLGLLSSFPVLALDQDRCLDRPARRKASDDQFISGFREWLPLAYRL